MTGIWRALKDRLRYSSHVHVRQEKISNLGDMIDLFDRFIDGAVRYDLEWDDFISWKNDNPAIEAVRDKIADLEPLFLSKENREIEIALQRLLDERNRCAVLLGRATRTK